MQIVINISEESYKNIKEQVDKRDYPDMQIGRAIADGVLIPKGHGKLVDIDKIDEDRIEKDNPVIYLTVNGEYIEAVSLDYLNSLPAIVGSDFRCKAEESKWQDASACKDCQNKCEEYHQWDKEMKK